MYRWALAAAALGAVFTPGPFPGRARVGRSRIPAKGSAEEINPAFFDEISTVTVDGVRFLYDGASVGLFRSLKGQFTRAVTATDDPKAEKFVAAIEIAPPGDGRIVPRNESAYAWVLGQAASGRTVAVPLPLLFDTSARRFLLAYAQVSDVPPGYAILCGPYLGPALVSLSEKGVSL